MKQQKDAFCNSENVTVCDSIISGEYLGRNAKDLTLINCTMSIPTRQKSYAGRIKKSKIAYAHDEEMNHDMFDEYQNT